MKGVSEIVPYITIAMFIMGLIAHSVKITARFAKSEKDLRQEFYAQLDNLQRDMKKLETETMDVYRRDVGETAAAIRQKIHDVETWNRDTFVRKDDFDLVIGRIEKSLDKLGDRFEEKIDALLDRMQK